MTSEFPLLIRRITRLKLKSRRHYGITSVNFSLLMRRYIFLSGNSNSSIRCAFPRNCEHLLRAVCHCEESSNKRQYGSVLWRGFRYGTFLGIVAKLTYEYVFDFITADSGIYFHWDLTSCRIARHICLLSILLPMRLHLHVLFFLINIST